MLNSLLSIVVYLTFALALHADSFDQTLEYPILSNIRQLTFQEMGFEKCGEAYFSKDCEWIAFQAVPFGQEHYQIYVMNLDERIPRMVSTGKGACTCANFSPDGKKLIFASSHEAPSNIDDSENTIIPGYQRNSGNYSWAFTSYMNIYEASLEGSNLTPLTTGQAYSAECSYSSDGSQIVFASNRDGHMNLYTMKSDGSEVSQVTFTTNSYNGGCFFSPDGGKILFRADYEHRNYLQIYTINTDGSHLEQLTSNEAVNWAPYWHPNGQTIAFTTSLHGHAHYEIYLLDSLSKDIYRVTHNASFDGLPVFSDNGQQLMWTSKRGLDHSCQIFIADFLIPKKFTFLQKR